MFVLMLLLFLTSADVLLRYIFNSPITDSYEVSEFGMGIVVFLGISYTALVKGHVRITLLTSRLPPRMQAVLDIIVNSLGIIVWLLIAWQGWKACLHNWQIRETTFLLGIPTAPFKALVPVGSIIFCLVLLTHILEFAKEIGKTK